jgi:hypothetical protein
VGSTGLLEAWWGTGSQRVVETLASARNGDYVLGCPPDVMALWSVGSAGGAVDIHTSRDGGGSWQVSTFEAPAPDQWWSVRCGPDGSFLAVDSESGMTVWRADQAGDSFREVFSAPGTPGSIGTADLRVQDGRVFASGDGVVAFSDDAGRTWTRVRTWR